MRSMNKQAAQTRHGVGVIPRREHDKQSMVTATVITKKVTLIVRVIIAI